jgi:hypothetical protein
MNHALNHYLLFIMNIKRFAHTNLIILFFFS